MRGLIRMYAHSINIFPHRQGYYRVWTQHSSGAAVQSELTATPHSAAHRWSFANASLASAPTPSLILDLCHGLSYSPGDCRNASVALSEDGTELSGFVDSKGDYSGTAQHMRWIKHSHHSF